MNITTTMTLKVTPEELDIIRLALSQYSTRQLCKIFDIQRECEEQGVEDTISYIWVEYRQKIRGIIREIAALDA